jgi:hypothetical protein
MSRTRGLNGMLGSGQTWQTKQSIPHTTVKFLRRLRENARRLRPELWQQKNWLLHQDNAPSHTSFFTK